MCDDTDPTAAALMRAMNVDYVQSFYKDLKLDVSDEIALKIYDEVLRRFRAGGVEAFTGNVWREIYDMFADDPT